MFPGWEAAALHVSDAREADAGSITVPPRDGAKHVGEAMAGARYTAAGASTSAFGGPAGLG